MDQRKRLIISILLKTPRFITSERLAGMVGVSPRTIRNELKILAEEMEKRGFDISSSPRLGYRIAVESAEGIAQWLAGTGRPRPVTPEERLFYLAKKLLHGTVIVTDYLDELHLSDSTWEKDLEKCSTWFRQHQASVKRKKKTLTLITDEEKRRNLLYSYYLEVQRCSGEDLCTLLRMDYESFPQVHRALEKHIGLTGQDLTDDDFFRLLVFLLASESKTREVAEPESNSESSVQDLAAALFSTLDGLIVGFDEGDALLAAEFLEKLKREGFVFQNHRNKTLRILNSFVPVFFGFEPDEELVDGISRISFSFVAKRRYPNNPPYRLDALEKTYPKALDGAVYFLEELQKQLGLEWDEVDHVRLGLCFAAFIERKGGRLAARKIAVICSAGLAGSQLLAAKIKRLFPEVNILGVYPKHRLQAALEKEPDLLISTIELKTNLDVVVIENFLNDESFDAILPFLRRNQRGRSLFTQLISRNLFFTDLDCPDPDSVLKHLCKAMNTLSGNDGSLLTRILQREKLGSTAVGNLVAIPHAVPDGKSGNRIAAAVLKNPIRWGREWVQVVLLLQLDGPELDLAGIFDYVYTLLSNKTWVHKLIKEKQYSLLIKGE